MAEKPKFIYVNKKNELVWEVPGLGSVSFRDERHKKGAHGQVNAYLKRDGKEYRVGWLGYNVMSNPDAGHGHFLLAFSPVVYLLRHIDGAPKKVSIFSLSHLPKAEDRLILSS